jgi:PhzF family phenazine biosynthesis protein
MTLTIYQVDAFTNTLFHGNPAGVIILDRPLEKHLMQHIAMENNLSETAFAVKKDGYYDIRWFTPATEVDLCGHATLATAHVLFTHLHHPTNEVCFKSRHRGFLRVRRDGAYLTLDFPADTIRKTTSPKGLLESIGKKPNGVWRGTTDYLLVYATEQDIRDITPDFTLLRNISVRGTIITAPGEKTDFVSRFFAPKVGVNEDPVTGSAHTLLIPYWARRLNKKRMTATQLSRRQGNLRCTLVDDRVHISGKAITYLLGELPNLP